uniref:Uncharacterized protein n=1 Tax=Anguilla anguilla TaxID=7936 RepID=A0A0E9VR59_ANGAN
MYFLKRLRVLPAGALSSFSPASPF